MKHHHDSAPVKLEQNSRGVNIDMKGFDEEFADIVDYILRITYRIWEGKQVGLCYDYYSSDCPVYTLAGITLGAEEVVQNTLNTLAAFPDRTLDAKAIIWDGNAEDGFHTSHRISSHMTNTGTSDMGQATGRDATIEVIAHCIVRNNKVVEEWLVRDNYSLATQLGFDPQKVAAEKARQPAQQRFLEWRDSELVRLEKSIRQERTVFSGIAEQEPATFIRATLQNIWNARLTGDVFQSYATEAKLHASGNRELLGHDAIIDFYLKFLGTFSELKHSVDYVCHNAFTNKERSGVDVAARWTLSGRHTGPVLYGEPSHCPVLILGESHYRIMDGVIIEEWTVFDELSVLVEIQRALLRQAEKVEPQNQ